MKYKNEIMTVFFIAILAGLFFLNFSNNKDSSSDYIESVENIFQEEVASKDQDVDEKNYIIFPPINKVLERTQKKSFGSYITPRNSPIQPERFTGFHTGIDMEIFPEENGAEVSFFSACSGKIIFKNNAGGYGGLLIQSCEIEKNPVTIVYGHIKLSSIVKNINESLEMGERIGFLGDAYSGETDGERKHLHFGIHKGIDIDILGYVKSEKELSGWIDPCMYLCEKTESER